MDIKARIFEIKNNKEYAIVRVCQLRMIVGLVEAFSLRVFFRSLFSLSGPLEK
jgi:hypothetical protein